jgi:hypothetical protein
MSAIRSAQQEGREAAKDSRPRRSPYESVRGLNHLSKYWYAGYDAMTPTTIAGSSRPQAVKPSRR